MPKAEKQDTTGRTIADYLKMVSTNDPAVRNYLRWREFNTTANEIMEQSMALRDALLRRHGLPVTKWEKDPDWSKRKSLDREFEYYSEAVSAAEDTVLQAPAETLEGALAKIEVSIHLLRQEIELNYEAQKAFSVLHQLRDFLAGQIKIPDASAKEAA